MWEDLPPIENKKSSKACPEQMLVSGEYKWMNYGEEYDTFLKWWLYGGGGLIEAPPSVHRGRRVAGDHSSIKRGKNRREEIKGLHIMFVAWIASFVFLLVSLVVGVLGLILGFFT